MITDDEFIDQWRQIRSEFPKDSEENIAVFFGVEVLRKWGWPFKPSLTSDSYPPINQTFLGYYPGEGWLMDRWAENFSPMPEQIPFCWISLNVLPTPDHYS